MIELKIFYSWQSDLPNKFNRGLLEKLLKKIATQFNKNKTIQIKAVIDRDTQNVAGAPNIVNTIFDKIDRCNIFIGDISIINLFEDNTARRMPNPNVLIELGYAAAKLGWENIILLYNLDYGRIEDIPFDLKQRRPVFYTLSDRSVEPREKNIKILHSQLSNAIFEVISSVNSRIESIDHLFPFLHKHVFDLYQGFDNFFDKLILKYFRGNIIQTLDVHSLSISELITEIEAIEENYKERQLEYIALIKTGIPKSNPNTLAREELRDNFQNHENDFRDSVEDDLDRILQFRHVLSQEIVNRLYSLISSLSVNERILNFDYNSIFLKYGNGVKKSFSSLKINKIFVIDLLFQIKEIRELFNNTYANQREKYKIDKNNRKEHIRKIIAE